MTEAATNRPDLALVRRISDADIDVDDPLQAALTEARAFIKFYDWVGGIASEFCGSAIAGILYAFLFEIIPERDDVDTWIWVIVGDLPPAYITCDDAKTPFEAVDGYVGALEEWVEAARTGRSVADLIPVNVPATPANAALLAARLKFIDDTILPHLN